MSRDPRVISLTYGLAPSERIEWVSPPPLLWSNDVADFELRDCILTCVLKQDFTNEIDAKLAVKLALREWSACAELSGHPIPLDFQFRSAEIKQPDPPAPGEASVALNFKATGTATLWSFTGKRQLREYPRAPIEFTLAEPAQEMWERYQACKAGHPKPALAYGALTLLEGLVPPGKKRRERAASLLSIEKDVLDVWGDLSTNRGEGVEKRKADGKQKPFTQQEADWLLAALRRGALQVGRFKANAPLTPLTMSDLPIL